jgi:hypothetical protein
MRFEYRKITLAVDLGEYYEAYQGKFVHVWVNPPRAKRLEGEMLMRQAGRWLEEQIQALRAEGPKSKPTIAEAVRRMLQPGGRPDIVKEISDRTHAWIADIWSQAPDPEAHWTADEVRQMDETDPRLFEWLAQRTLELMDIFRAGLKKA